MKGYPFENQKTLDLFYLELLERLWLMSLNAYGELLKDLNLTTASWTNTKRDGKLGELHGVRWVHIN